MTAERLPWISADPASQSVFELAQKVAAAPSTLLISGESGAGKDYLARVIHELGPRRDAPFLKIDCASLPPQLVESELFGHERGAFTGAVERKLGRLCSMKWRRFPRRRRASCCACCRSARSNGWAERKHCILRRGWWR